MHGKHSTTKPFPQTLYNILKTINFSPDNSMNLTYHVTSKNYEYLTTPPQPLIPIYLKNKIKMSFYWRDRALSTKINGI